MHRYAVEVGDGEAEDGLKENVASSMMDQPRVWCQG